MVEELIGEFFLPSLSANKSEGEVDLEVFLLHEFVQRKHPRVQRHNRLYSSALISSPRFYCRATTERVPANYHFFFFY